MVLFSEVSLIIYYLTRVCFQSSINMYVVTSSFYSPINVNHGCVFEMSGNFLSSQMLKKSNTYYVTEENLNNFIVAFIKLHHTPGINPYSLMETAKLSFLSAQRMRPSTGYWWTSPDLTDETSTPFFTFSEPLYLDDIVYMNPEIHTEYVNYVGLNYKEDKEYINPKYLHLFGKKDCLTVQK